MASVSKMMETKDGRRYWKISVSRGYGKSPYVTRFYWPTKKDGSPVAETKALKDLSTRAAEFEADCKSGKVLNREQEKEKAAREAAEAAKLKTFAQYADGVFMPTKEATFSENARLSYRMFLDKHIFPVLGDKLLTEISPAMVNKLLADFQKQGYAHASAVKLYNIINGVFTMAFFNDSIPINPMLKVKRPAVRKDETLKDESEKAMTAKELSYVFACVSKEPLKWQAYVILAADSAARRGELCGLKWEDVDLKAGTIEIKRNLQYSKDRTKIKRGEDGNPLKGKDGKDIVDDDVIYDGVYECTPKNGKSRTVDIGEDTVEILRKWHIKQSSSHVSKWVFSQDGAPDPIHPQSPTRFFKKFGEKYGISNFHPHILRHSSASIAITNGADIVSVSERLGHSDTAVTLRMYAHANQESIRRAGQVARDAIKAQVG